MILLSRRDWLRTAAVAPAALAFPIPRLAAAPTADDLKPIVDKAVKFLASRQKENGDLAPSPRVGPGVTALAVAALIRNGYADNPVAAKGLAFLEKNIKADGGVYSQGLETYTTSLAIVAFKEANAAGKYTKVIDAATKFVRSLQYGDGLDPKDVKVGGVGYGKPGGRDRPDLSNTQFMVDALIAAGASKDDPAIRKALGFISRCQNLSSEEYNDQPFAEKTTEDDKGGFVYNPLDQNNDKSDKRTAAGGLRSEGGMTYAGLKSFLYAGVGKDDPRVKAAIAWIRKHYTVEENPGQGQAGLFYYYVTFAKAMGALGEDPFVDAKGTKHDWRQELFDALKKKQKADGSWANENRAFLENAPELATSFALMALSYTKGK